MSQAVEIDGVTWTAEVRREAPGDDADASEAKNSQVEGEQPDDDRAGPERSREGDEGAREETRVWLRSSDGREQSINVGYVEGDGVGDIDASTVRQWVREYFPDPV